MAERHSCCNSSLRPRKNAGYEVAANHHAKNRETRVTVGHPERGWLSSSLDTS